MVEQLKHLIKIERRDLSYFEISMEIGISETTLYRFMNYNEYSNTTLHKIKTWCEDKFKVEV